MKNYTLILHFPRNPLMATTLILFFCLEVRPVVISLNHGKKIRLEGISKGHLI